MLGFWKLEPPYPTPGSLHWRTNAHIVLQGRRGESSWELSQPTKLVSCAPSLFFCRSVHVAKSGGHFGSTPLFPQSEYRSQDSPRLCHLNCYYVKQATFIIPFILHFIFDINICMGCIVVFSALYTVQTSHQLILRT